MISTVVLFPGKKDKKETVKKVFRKVLFIMTPVTHRVERISDLERFVCNILCQEAREDHIATAIPPHVYYQVLNVFLPDLFKRTF